VTLTPKMLAALRQKATGATPGPWTRTAEGWIVSPASGPDDARGWPTDPVVGAWVDDGELRISLADADFIASANPVVVLALLDRLAELEGEQCPNRRTHD
jgi:hypothetical protein